MISKLYQVARVAAQAVLTQARSRCGQLLSTIRRTWSAHQKQIMTNTAYLAAITTAAASLVSQANLPDLVMALIAGVLAVHAAIRRGIQRRGPDHGDPYGTWDRF